MADNVTPGDLIVDELAVYSPRGVLDLTSSFVSASIYESIFTPGIVADINILDTNDQVGILKPSGDETIRFKFRAPGQPPSLYFLALDTIANVEITSAVKSKTYTFKCVSEEALNAKTNFVQKSYNTQISGIVTDIFKRYLKSKKEIVVEPTKGKQKIIVPNYNPYKAIDMVRRRAVSNFNLSSAYVFFETRNDNGDQSFKFVTIENLFKQYPIKAFKQEDTIGSDVYKQYDNNIVAYEMPKQLSTADRIAMGAKRRVAKFNFRTHDYVYQDITPDPTKLLTGGVGDYNSQLFDKKYITDVKIPPISFVPYDSAARPNTSIAEATPYQQVYIATLIQNAVKVRVPGDTILKAGCTVYAIVPEKNSLTSNKKVDPLFSGKFLVSRIHHKISSVGGRTPRYECIMELLKGNPNDRT